LAARRLWFIMHRAAKAPFRRRPVNSALGFTVDTIMDSLTKKKTDRFRFLHRLYERTNGDHYALEDMFEVGADVGLSRDDAHLVMQYLVGEGLATHRAIGGAVAMTHAGVVEVERALSTPETPTHYFPPVVNILHVQSMVGSQIQQGTHDSTQSQSQTISQNDLASIQTLLTSLQGNLANLGLSPEAHAEATAEVQTVEAQLRSTKPKAGILRESLRTLRNLVEGVASNALAAGILPLFAPVAALLGF
jgi:hypothetical protein